MDTQNRRCERTPSFPVVINIIPVQEHRQQKQFDTLEDSQVVVI
jgi:hypothetical protein